MPQAAGLASGRPPPYGSLAMTPERFHRLRRVLARRQPDLTVLMEVVHKPHNLSAVVRTLDAVGGFEAHAVTEEESVDLFHMLAGGAKRWVPVHTHPTLEQAAAELRQRGFRLLAAHPAEGTVDFREIDYTKPTAILLGQEKDGLTDAAVAAADRWIAIPMKGMGASLNVSVAAALILFEAERQRQAAGLYETSRLPPERFERTLFEWAYPEVARLCREAGRPYPALSDDGEILGEVPRGKR